MFETAGVDKSALLLQPLDDILVSILEDNKEESRHGSQIQVIVETS